MGAPRAVHTAPVGLVCWIGSGPIDCPRPLLPMVFAGQTYSMRGGSPELGMWVSKALPSRSKLAVRHTTGWSTRHCDSSGGASGSVRASVRRIEHLVMEPPPKLDRPLGLQPQGSWIALNTGAFAREANRTSRHSDERLILRRIMAQTP